MNPPLALTAKIEAAYPGLKIIAGPFKVNATSPVVAKSEKAECVRVYRQQPPGSKIIMHTSTAYVLRPAEGWWDTPAERQRKVLSAANVKNPPHKKHR
jgi:hypothetical protein